MKIVCCFGDDRSAAAPWVSALAAALPQATVVDEGDDADVAVVWRAPQAFFDRQRRVRTVFAAGAGVDGLLALRLPPGVMLVRLQDAGMGEQMADHVVHALLGFFRRRAEYAAQQAARAWRPLPPECKADWPVGLLGLGVLGTAVARAVGSLGFPVAAWTRRPRDVPGIDTFAGPDALDAFLARTRVLVDVLPLTAETHALLDARRFAQLMAPGYLINVARGAHVVEADLLDALDSGQLGGAALDVCLDEPAAPDHPFWSHPRIVFTPHVAAATLRDEAVAQIAAGVRALERGETPPGLVPFDRGY